MNSFDIITKYIEGDAVVYPISDIHLGAIEHNEKAWAKFCNKILDEPNSYITLGGDLVNNNVVGSVGNPWEEKLRPSQQKRLMAEQLRPLKDRILCAVVGNHEKRRGNRDVDDDPMYDILSKLDLEDLYRKEMAVVNINLGKRKGMTAGNRASASYNLVVMHGAGGGIYTGATVNRNERFGNIIEGADCLIVGHTHKGTVSRPSKLVINSQNKLVTMKSYVVISSVSWLDFGGYALEKMLLPAETSRPQKLLLNKKYKDIEVVW